MIQRIQSIYLALAAAALLALFFFDGLWQAERFAAPYTVLPTIVAVLTLATALLIGVTMFSYANRKRQRKMVVASQVMTLLLLFVLGAAVYFFGAPGIPAETAGGEANLLAFLPLVLPIAAYACLVLARRGIDKDIALVRSMDRLR